MQSLPERKRSRWCQESKVLEGNIANENSTAKWSLRNCVITVTSGNIRISWGRLNSVSLREISSEGNPHRGHKKRSSVKMADVIPASLTFGLLYWCQYTILLIACTPLEIIFILVYIDVGAIYLFQTMGRYKKKYLRGNWQSDDLQNAVTSMRTQYQRTLLELAWCITSRIYSSDDSSRTKTEAFVNWL